MLLVESCLAPSTAKLELAGSNITPNGLDSDYMNLFICQACKIVNAEVSLKKFVDINFHTFKYCNS